MEAVIIEIMDNGHEIAFYNEDAFKRRLLDESRGIPRRPNYKLGRGILKP